jgi:MFS family permease
MTVQGATLTLLVFGAGNFMGMILAGAVGRFLYRKDVRYPTVFAGIMAMLGCIPLWLMINYIDLNPSKGISAWSWLWIFFVSFLAGVCSGVTGPIVKAILQNVTLPDARGQAFAMLNTTDDFGRGLGPYFVSKLIQSLGGRQRAFNIGTLGWVLCGLFILCMYFTVRQDEERVQSILLDDFSIVSFSMEGSTSVAVGNGHEESSFLLVDANEVESISSSTNNRVDPVSSSSPLEPDMAIKLSS